MILFDTDVCIEMLRGNKKVIEKRKKYEGDVAVSFMSAAELFYGAEKSGNAHQNIELVEEFLLSITIVDSEIEIMKLFGTIKAQLSRQNVLLPDADIFIAATSLARCEKLITGNTNHFKRIDSLKIENWIR